MSETMARETETRSWTDNGVKSEEPAIERGQVTPTSEVKSRAPEIEFGPSAATTEIARLVARVTPNERAMRQRRRRLVPFLVTLTTVVIALALGRMMWDAYMETPWTRDGTVRVDVVTMASEVAGRIVELPVRDNQFVHKGDLLMVIDPTNYKIAVSLAEASVQQAQADMWNAARQSRRRQMLTDLATTAEEKETFATKVISTKSQYQQAQANLAQARVNFERTEIRSPVDGWVTNLLARQGDFATAGQNLIAVTDANSFWVDGYFEETSLGRIQVDDPADIKLMGYSQIIRGHVQSIARAINVANAQPDRQGVATVNPIFTWVRLAQRVPVRIHIDSVPNNVMLVAGMIATVQIDPLAY
jgi:multidrug resistance efflux pump